MSNAVYRLQLSIANRCHILKVSVSLMLSIIYKARRGQESSFAFNIKLKCRRVSLESIVLNVNDGLGCSVSRGSALSCRGRTARRCV